jgi:type IV secretory pathway protease TraF
MQKEKYDRILYVKDGIYYFERITGSKISKVNFQRRKIIIDGLLDPEVAVVKCDDNGRQINYYYAGGNRKKICRVG